MAGRRRAADYQAQIDILNQQLDKERQRADDAELRAAEAEAKAAAMDEVSQYAVKNLQLMLPERILIRYTGKETPAEQFKELVRMFIDLIVQDNWLKKFIFGHFSRRAAAADQPAEEKESSGSGGAQSTAGSSPEDLAKELTKKNEEIVSKRRRRTKKELAEDCLAKGLHYAAEARKQELNDAGLKAAAGSPKDSAAKHRPGRKTKPHTGRSRRRSEHLSTNQPAAAQIEQAKQFAIAHFKCPNCGCEREPEVSDIMTAFCDSAAAQHLMTKDNGAYRVVAPRLELTCPNCGFTDWQYPLEAPLLPGRDISLEFMCMMAMLYSMGFAVNACRKIFVPAMGLGHSTLYDGLITFSYLLLPLYNASKQQLKCCYEIVLDETKHPRVDAKGAHTLYIPFACTPVYNEVQALLFGPPDSRSSTADFVRDVLKDSNIKAIVSDGYASYETVAGEKGIKLQRCLAHLAVKIANALESLNSTSVQKFIDGGEQLMAEIVKRGHFDPASLNDAVIILFFIAQKLSLIFAWEAFAWDLSQRRHIELSEARRIVRAKRSAPIMDDIDVLFNLLAPVYAKKVGTSWQQQGAKLIAEPVVYYLNGAKYFRTFLTEPNVQISSQDAEHAAKVMAAARNASLFTRKDASGEACSIIVSCIHTIQRNHVRDVPGHLLKIAKWSMEEGVRRARLEAFKHADPAKRQPRLNFNRRELYEQLELPAELLPWNAAKAEQEQETAASG